MHNEGQREIWLLLPSTKYGINIFVRLCPSVTLSCAQGKWKSLFIANDRWEKRKKNL